MGERTSTPSAGARPRPVKADGPPKRAFPLVRRLCAFALRKSCDGFPLVEPDQGTEEYRQARGVGARACHDSGANDEGHAYQRREACPFWRGPSLPSLKPSGHEGHPEKERQR
jgi:hypothetical protein